MADTDVGLQHVAIVMDGNGRWASKRFLPRISGHKQGVDTLKRIVRACAQRHIAVLTVFAFSSENGSRPEAEVSGLMDLLAAALAREVSQLKQDGVRLRFVGDRSGLSERVQASLARAEHDTADNSVLTLNVCFNYGGRWEIAHAAAQLDQRGEPITVDSLSRAMALSASDPDLLIRTGGEFRLSKFLLWQCAYTELYFSPALWPDFDEQALDQAIAEYHARERRFGKTSAQLTPSSVSPK